MTLSLKDIADLKIRDCEKIQFLFVRLSVGMFEFPIITHELLNQFASQFDWGTQ